jgi:hypothetical protein
MTVGSLSARRRHSQSAPPSDRQAADVAEGRPVWLAGALVPTAWLVIMLGSTASIGGLNPRTVPTLLLGLGMLLWARWIGRGRCLPAVSGLDLMLLLTAGTTAMFVPLFTYLPAGDLGWLTLSVAGCAALTAISVGLADSPWAQPAWWFGVVGGLGALVVVVALDRRPAIDVWFILQQSAEGLLHGHNFYAQSWTGSPGWQQLYPYLPVTTLLLAPFRWLFGDVRIGLLACLAGSVLLVGRPWRPGPRQSLAALLLFAPGSIALVEQSWSEPVLLVLLIATFLAVESGHLRLAVLSFALALAAKQHLVVLLPLFACWPAFGWRRTGLAVAGAAAICLPWFLADPSAFWNGTVRTLLTLPPRPDAPTLFTVALQHGWRPSAGLVVLLLLGAGTAAGWAVRRQPRPGNACLLAALLLLALSLLNKQSFYNQYWLAAQLLIVATALDRPTEFGTERVRGARSDYAAAGTSSRPVQ